MMDAYLSRLVLDPRSRDVQKDLADVHRLHQRVMSGFPDDVPTARKALGILYRVDTGAGVALLVQSKAAPTWTTLPDRYLATDWLEEGSTTVATTSMKPILDRCVTGTDLRFRLRANPTRFIDSKTGDDGKRRGKRVPLRKDESRLEWLGRKARENGFAVIDVRQAERAVPDVIQHEPGVVRGWREGHHLTLEGVLFEGRLRVVETERFRAAILDGIGRGKAYGFGLLSVAPG